MELRVSAPGKRLSHEKVEAIERDLDKLDRRLNSYREVYADLRISGNNSTPDYLVVLEVRYSHNHLIAKTSNPDMGMAVREAREDILRQINDRARGSHSDYAKGR